MVEYLNEHQVPPVEIEDPFAGFLLNGNSEAMKKKMLDDKYILGEIALLGQATVLYAKPNTGKTLLTMFMLAEKVIKKEIDGSKVIYVNADDTHRGLVQKLEIAEQTGFGMIAPGYQNFRADTLLITIAKLIKTDTAHGVIIILDTLKKFTDIMDKRKASEFGRIVRAFVSKGGSMIMLAHTNKHRDTEGKLIYSGTSDIVDDVDCAYIMDSGEPDGLRTSVIFENIKSRGDVAKTAGYSYSAKEKQSYWELLDSVMIVDERERETAKKQQSIEREIEKNSVLIAAIIECISEGITLKTDLVDESRKRSGESKKKVIAILSKYCGNSFKKGHRWFEKKGDRASKNFELLPQTMNEQFNNSNGE